MRKWSITSGTLLTPEWKPYRNGILKADIRKGLNMDMLCVDDDIRYQARYPDYDSTAIRFNGVAADAVRTTIIHNNRFRCDRGWDIDLDDGSSNYHIYNNLCLNGGIKLREGFYRVVENNILVNNTFHPHVWFPKSGDVFQRNIVMSPYQPINLNGWGATINNNIFTDSISYQTARQYQTDNESVVYPVHFINPQTGNYQIADIDSPVFRLGFQNIRMNNFGVRSPHLRHIALTPEFSIPTINESVRQDKIIDWQGLQIKDLNTMGERSATGMDAERGVYIYKSSHNKGTLSKYLYTNDVILGINGFTINNLFELRNALKQTDCKQPIRLTIIRNQQQLFITLPANIIKE